MSVEDTDEHRVVAFDAQLRPMVACINRYLSNPIRSQPSRHAVMRAAADFCLNYPESFRRAFLGQLEAPQALAAQAARSRPVLHEFAKTLANREGECVFLLRDAFGCMEAYQTLTGHGFGVTVNRTFLCPEERDYLGLLELTYSALRGSDDFAAFRAAYEYHFDELLLRRPDLAAAAREIARYVAGRAGHAKITFVDTGSQFTFALFCAASLRRFGRGHPTADVYAYSTYPWLQPLFKGRYFSAESPSALELERIGVTTYRTALEDRAAGALVGLAVGDALGYPAAGVEHGEMGHYVSGGRIVKFQNAPKHPYFHNLAPGQYTSNTIFAKLMARHLLRNGGYREEVFIDSLRCVGAKALAAPEKFRWIGPTTLASLKDLSLPMPKRRSSRKTRSCAAAYRSVPLGLFYRPMGRRLVRAVATIVTASARITHNSEVSAAGSLFVATLIADLIQGVPPETAVTGALRGLRRTRGVMPLIEKLDLALKLSRDASSVDEARQVFGTGSPIDQTLPLAIYCFLRTPKEFRQVVLDAANSFRVDSDDDRQRFAQISAKAAMQAATGGNSDGIAALAGAFAGARLGISAIPSDLLEVEGRDELVSLAKSLVGTQCMGDGRKATTLRVAAHA